MSKVVRYYPAANDEDLQSVLESTKRSFLSAKKTSEQENTATLTVNVPDGQNVIREKVSNKPSLKNAYYEELSVPEGESQKKLKKEKKKETASAQTGGETTE